MTDVTLQNRARRAEHGIYGSIVVLAVVVADDAAAVSTRVAVATVIGAAIATSLAHVYADYIGELIRARRHPTRSELGEAIRNAAAGFGLAILPVLVLVLAATGAISLDVAFDVAEWVGVAVLGLYAVVANRRAGLPLWRSILIGLGFAAIGAGLVALKVLL